MLVGCYGKSPQGQHYSCENVDDDLSPVEINSEQASFLEQAGGFDLLTCRLTSPGDLPKTRYPPNRPARKVSYGPSLPQPVGPIYFKAHMDDLYTTAKQARFRACVLVAFNTIHIFFFRLQSQKCISIHLRRSVGGKLHTFQTGTKISSQ